MNIAVIRRTALALLAVVCFGIGAATQIHADVPSASPIAPPQQPLEQPAQQPPDELTQQATRIVLSFDRLGYEWWGRPYFIDDPDRKNCDSDDSKRALMLSIGIRVRNTSKVAMTPESWDFVFLSNRGKRAPWCFRAAAKQDPNQLLNVAAGSYSAFAVQVFVEPQERVRSVYVLDKNLGRSNTLLVPTDTPIPQIK